MILIGFCSLEVCKVFSFKKKIKVWRRKPMRLPRILWFSFYTSIYHVRYLSVCWSFFYQIDTNVLILNSFFTSSINNCETGVFTSLVLQWLREVVLTCMWEISFFNQSLQLYCKCKVEISFDFFSPFFW